MSKNKLFSGCCGERQKRKKQNIALVTWQKSSCFLSLSTQ